MPYIGAGVQRFNTADNLTVSGTSELKNNVTVTGDVTASGTVLPTGDTAAGDAAALGFTSAEGLILTGQGSTSDITFKNDADTTVFTIPTGTDDISFPDNAAILMGAGNDLKIFHNGSNSQINDLSTGNLQLLSNGAGVDILKTDGEVMAKFITDGAVELYHDNSKKLETASGGISVTGEVAATSLDISGDIDVDGTTNLDAVDIDGNVDIATTATLTCGAITSSISDHTNLTLTSTNADGTAGPKIVLNRDSGSPAIGDSLGQILYKFDNESAESTEAIRINAILADSTDGSEDARLQIEQMFGGSMFSFLEMSKDGIVFNENSQNIDLRVESDGNTKMFIVDAGNNSVMVGDDTGASYSDGGLFVRHAGGANNSPLCVVNGTTSGTRRMVDFFVGTGTSRVGSIQSNDSATAFNTSSDYRLKENVADMTGAIDRVKALAPKRFNFIISPDTIVDGFLAHEVSSIVPEAISGEKDEVATWGKEEKLPDGVKVGDNKLDNNGDTIPIMQGIDHSKLVPLLTAALKEAVAKIESLEARVTTLEGE